RRSQGASRRDSAAAAEGGNTMKKVISLLLMGVTLTALAQDNGNNDRRNRDRGNNNSRGERSERSGSTTQPASRGAGYEAEYTVLSDRNIFLRERVRPRGSNGPTTRRTNEAAPLTPEQSFALRGVVFEDDEIHAYFENIPESSIQRVAIGEELS